MKVFFDTNVLLDVLAERRPFYDHSMQLWSLAETGRVEGLVSAISINNCFYVIRKFSGRDRAQEAMRLLRDIFYPVAMTPQLLTQAMDAGFDDFEDALQYFSGLHARADCLLTRNPDHFPHQVLPILTPGEFLAAYSELAE